MRSRHYPSPCLVQTVAACADVKGAALVYSSWEFDPLQFKTMVSAISQPVPKDGTSWLYSIAEDTSEHSPKGAPVPHRWQGASNSGRYRLFPVTEWALAEWALRWLVYLGTKPHSVLPLHCSVPRLISLPETDALEWAVTRLERTEPRPSDHD